MTTISRELKAVTTDSAALGPDTLIDPEDDHKLPEDITESDSTSNEWFFEAIESDRQDQSGRCGRPYFAAPAGGLRRSVS
jgi:hypothetical protein